MHVSAIKIGINLFFGRPYTLKTDQEGRAITPVAIRRKSLLWLMAQSSD